MEKFKPKINTPEVDPSEFNNISGRGVKSKLGDLIIGAMANSTGVWVLIQEKNRNLYTKKLGEALSAVDPNWSKIERIAKEPKTPRLTNIRLDGDYSRMYKKQ